MSIHSPVSRERDNVRQTFVNAGFHDRVHTTEHHSTVAPLHYQSDGNILPNDPCFPYHNS